MGGKGSGNPGQAKTYRAGRNIADIPLGKDARKTLKILVLSRGLAYTRENCGKVVMDLIEADWRKMDAEYQREAHEWQGEAL